MNTNSTDRTVIDTSKDHLRILKSGEITESVVDTSQAVENWTNNITFDDIFYSDKNIVDIFFDYDTAFSGASIVRFNTSGFYYELSDGGGDKLKIRADSGGGVPPIPPNFKVYYIIYTGRYA